VGTDWLPVMLRVVEPKAQEEVAPVAEAGE
jgi:hypothetical protein